MDIYPYQVGDDILRDDAWCYYLVAADGVYIVKRNPLFSTVLRAVQIAPTDARRAAAMRAHADDLGVLEETCYLHEPSPKIPLAMLQEIIGAFRAIYATHHAECHAQLFYDEETGVYSYAYPEVWTSGLGDFCWFEFLPTPPGLMWVGTIHSHGKYCASHSHIDYETESAVDGIHITIGELDHPFPSIDCRIVVDGLVFQTPAENIVRVDLESLATSMPTVHILDVGLPYLRGSFGARAKQAYLAPVEVVERERERSMAREFVLIGLGGIGSHFAPIVCRWLSVRAPGSIVILVDGKPYEARKADRQAFVSVGNKATVQATTLQEQFPELTFRPIPRFVDAANVAAIIPDGATVFLMPDNHRTRKIVSDHAETLRSCVVIAGGNDAVSDPSRGYEGNILVHVRKDGQDRTAPITLYHPEIAAADDEAPTAASCEQMQRSAPQLLGANVAVAAHMLQTAIAVEEGSLTYGELCFSIGGTPRVEVFERKPRQKTRQKGG